ncbi:hypothetical protein BY998_10350 [Methylobacterium sp. B4]|nr:hypothetical protein BY998_10350 [Methylobacterium sp. B4]
MGLPVPQSVRRARRRPDAPSAVRDRARPVASRRVGALWTVRRHPRPPVRRTSLEPLDRFRSGVAAQVRDRARPGPLRRVGAGATAPRHRPPPVRRTGREPSHRSCRRVGWCARLPLGLEGTRASQLGPERLRPLPTRLERLVQIPVARAVATRRAAARRRACRSFAPRRTSSDEALPAAAIRGRPPHRCGYRVQARTCLPAPAGCRWPTVLPRGSGTPPFAAPEPEPTDQRILLVPYPHRMHPGESRWRARPTPRPGFPARHRCRRGPGWLPVRSVRPPPSRGPGRPTAKAPIRAAERAQNASPGRPPRPVPSSPPKSCRLVSRTGPRRAAPWPRPRRRGRERRGVRRGRRAPSVPEGRNRVRCRGREAFRLRRRRACPLRLRVHPSRPRRAVAPRSRGRRASPRSRGRRPLPRPRGSGRPRAWTAAG